MFVRINWYLSIILISIFLIGCKTSSTSNIKKNKDNKVNFNISVSKETGIQKNN